MTIDSTSFVNCTPFDVNLYNAADCNQLLHTYPASKNPVHAIFVHKPVSSDDGKITYKWFTVIYNSISCISIWSSKYFITWHITNYWATKLIIFI